MLSVKAEQAAFNVRRNKRREQEDKLPAPTRINFIFTVNE
ncbi:conserved hypothetical protein [Yersinia pestis Pestoides F]|uniref:Uncharacterized protein n=1 Tax=Yersinia pestis TaxID=632 RepID=Q8CKU3_YERPE|nr:hypothetical [Yersinia pestis KIM10+]ABP40740.1 conserved hypothetical protein [Yersinia pestis Pestoides F]